MTRASPPSTDHADWVGRSRNVQDILTPSAVQTWSATLDNGDTPHDIGAKAPQGIHWILCPPIEPAAELGPDGHPVKGGFLPPIAFPRRMWAGSSLAFLSPLHIGDAVTKTSTIAAVTQKSGKSGEMVFLDIDHSYTVEDVECVKERQTIVYRHADLSQPDAKKSNKLPESDWTWQRDVHTDPVLMFRWSAITFNAHRIHYDLPYATDVEGYPGLVVQGPLIATLLLDLCSRNLGANALKTFSFRALSPVFCGDTLSFLGQNSPGKVALCAASRNTGVKMQASATLAD